jgi:hypothetical protein
MKAERDAVTRAVQMILFMENVMTLVREIESIVRGVFYLVAKKDLPFAK